MKLTQTKLKELILEELKTSENELAAKKPMQGDVKRVIDQFRSTIQSYMDEINNHDELVGLLGHFIEMLKQKGVSSEDIKRALTTVRSDQDKPNM